MPFWKRKPEPPSLVEHRETCNRYAAMALEASGVDFDHASQLRQALIGTFVFGIVFSECQKQKLEPPQVHALALCVFQDTLHYTTEAAAQGVQACIDATAPGVHDTMRAIMHKGIDGHALCEKSKHQELSTLICEILNQFPERG